MFNIFRDIISSNKITFYAVTVKRLHRYPLLGLLGCLKTEITKIGSHGKKVPFHQDNAPYHKSLVTMAELHELQWELLPHPLYYIPIRSHLQN